MKQDEKGLSLCMIVRDEEDVLSRCLKSVSGIVDEIIIVDTGSIDNTKGIAEGFGARLFDYRWEDDFSAARNFSLEQARGDWILVLDADEVLVCDSGEQVRQLIEKPGIEGYFIKIINLLGDARNHDASEDWVVRLFKRKKAYRFEGAIHEQVRPAIERIAGEDSIKTAPLKIYHDGYRCSVVKNKGKVERNMRIAKKALVSNPKDPFLLYSLACEFFVSGEYGEALQTFRQAQKNINPTVGYLSDIYIKMSLCLYALGRFEEMDEFNNSSLSPDFLFVYGLLKMETGMFNEAEEAIRKCLTQINSGREGHMTIKDYQVYQALGEIHEGRKQWSEALRSYSLAVKARPSYLYPMRKMINILRAQPTLATDFSFQFGTPKEKCFLLRNLDWVEEVEIVIFILLNLAYDLWRSDPNITKILTYDVKLLLDEKSEGVRMMVSKDPRLVPALWLMKSLLSLAEIKGEGVLNVTERIENVVACIRKLVLIKPPLASKGSV